MHSAGQVGDRFDHIQLVQELASRTHLGKVLSFVDQYRQGTPVAQGLLDGVSIFGPLGLRIEAGVDFVLFIPWGWLRKLVPYQRLLHSQKNPLELIPPVEIARLWGYRLHAHDRNPTAIGLEGGDQALGKNLFYLCLEGCLADACRPKYRHQRSRRRPLNRGHQLVFRLHQLRMCQSETLKLLQSGPPRPAQQRTGKPHMSICRHQNSPYSSWTSSTRAPHREAVRGVASPAPSSVPGPEPSRRLPTTSRASRASRSHALCRRRASFASTDCRNSASLLAFSAKPWE